MFEAAILAIAVILILLSALSAGNLRGRAPEDAHPEGGAGQGNQYAGSDTRSAIDPAALARELGEIPEAEIQSSAEEMRAEIEELRVRLAGHAVTINDLGVKGRKAVAERDEWKSRAQEAIHRAEIAEELVAKSQSSGDTRFRTAKRQFANLFHPDNARGSDLERAVVEVVFKRYWTVLEEIERQG